MDENERTAWFPNSPTMPKPKEPKAETSSERQSLGDLLYRNDNLVSSLSHDVTDHANRLAAHQGLAPAERREAISTMAYVAHDAKLPRQDAVKMFASIVDNTVTPPTDAQQSAWKAEALEALDAKYGDRIGDVLAKVNAFMQANPDFEQRVARAKSLNNPAIILPLAERLANR